MTVYQTPENAFVDYGYRIEDFEDSFVGVYDSEEEYAYHCAEEWLGRDNPVLQAGYFDLKKYAMTLFSTDYFSAPAPGVRVYVFARN